MSEVKRFGSMGNLVKADPRLLELYPSMTVYTLASDYDALAAQRDEGLAREVGLKKELVQFQDGYTEQWQSREALQQRLSEAEKLLRGVHTGDLFGPDDWETVRAFLASPGCADVEPDFKSDQNAVYIFSKLMLHKLAKKAAEGRSGWQECSQARLTRMLREHVEKGDPVDVANFCMMLCANGMSIGPSCANGEKSS